MAFVKKDWKNDPDTSTPLSAEAMEDLETRLSDYTDTEVETQTNALQTETVEYINDEIATHNHSTNQIPTTGLQDNAITNAKVADGAVNTAEIADGAITPAKVSNAWPALKAKPTPSSGSLFSVPNNTPTLLTWSSGGGDFTDNMLTATTGGTIMVNTAGYYMVSVDIQWSLNVTGNRKIELRRISNVPGESTFTTYLFQEVPATSLGTQHNQRINGLIYFSYGVPIDLGVYVTQNSGGALNIFSESTTSQTQWYPYQHSTLTMAWVASN